MESLFPQEDAARTRTKEAARRHRAGLRAAVRQLMRSPEGRDLLRWLLDVCGAFNAEYTPESGALYFLQGQRHVGMTLLRLLQEDDAANLSQLLETEHA